MADALKAHCLEGVCSVSLRYPLCGASACLHRLPCDASDMRVNSMSLFKLFDHKASFCLKRHIKAGYSAVI